MPLPTKVQEQLTRIHNAVHSGTLDAPSIDDALSQLASMFEAEERRVGPLLRLRLPRPC